MARLLAYLFDVTERFGMETRTELILLQRTMVVVEGGVARCPQPCDKYVGSRASGGGKLYPPEPRPPRAAARDLLRAAQVLGRYGPKLPA